MPESLVSRDGFSRSVPRQPAHLHTQAESGAYPQDSSRFPRRRPVFIYFKPPHAIGSVPSLSGHAIAYRWRSLPRVRRHRASKPQGSSSNGCCHFAGHHGPINTRLSFSIPTITNIGMTWTCYTPYLVARYTFSCICIEGSVLREKYLGVRVQETTDKHQGYCIGRLKRFLKYIPRQVKQSTIKNIPCTLYKRGETAGQEKRNSTCHIYNI